MISILNEIAVLRRYASPHIIQLEQIIESTSSFYFILEYMEGGTLLSKLRRDKVQSEH